ncbi:6-phosphogluconolactonase [Nitrosococcus oceani ATCC 19707]|uniref:6-phosphogluconolactonase n=2 Tax=Nitrosococcus oceani TaxID=1229 RepID=Q3JBF3_NITOC|nr:6-phosphogluconolactonase [Nitrosococcus oceani]ABA57843.1 6-phosphogluconolactonase [Nitrosococcus oceani ATCC 19707]EDZ67698.1 6-phosphogluconolactonase [Nitrosococcus oceani AFC27]KFI19723.1 6-phosphogluconolactonase [Nitrosococcus oceani C-27]GEM19480.1 6-phosphogluconolactonase [Nitrosococcus oceani]
MANIQVFPTPAALYHSAAEYWVRTAKRAIERAGTFHIALAGGSTPRALYQLLATEPYAGQIDWRRIHVYFGDERYVPRDHPDSNYRMAREALLDSVAIPPEQILRIQTEFPEPELAADDYAQVLQSHLPEGEIFDLILLGLGADGHTASLFPETPILTVRDRLAAAVYVKKLKAWRISITYPAVEKARQILFLVTGADKAAVVTHVLSPSADKTLPVQHLQAQGEVSWYLDAEAARKWEVTK